MPVIPAGFGQVTFLYTGAAHPTGAAWTVGFEQAGVSDPDEIAGLFAGNESNNISLLRASNSILTTVRVKLGPVSTGLQVDLGVSVPGQGSPPAVEPNTAALVRKNTALGGRKQRGRMYLPGATDDTFDSSGVMGSGSVDAFTISLDQFFADAVSDQVPLVLLHGDATAPTPLTSLVIQTRAATQRRRLRR